MAKNEQQDSLRSGPVGSDRRPACREPRAPAGKASALVACYIGAAYWFTASTSFANPAAVLGRMFTDSFSGIAPSSVLEFVLAEVTGAATGFTLHRSLSRTD